MGVPSVEETLLPLGRRAVFLDRDGVLNRACIRNGRPFPPDGATSMLLLPGAVEACDILRRAGLILIVVTNQPDVARGSTTLASVNTLHEDLRRRVAVDEIVVCPHDDADGCGCRKPAPGMVIEAATRWSVDLGRSVLVGDRWRDVEAGRRAGCRTVFIDHGYSERAPVSQDLTASSLADAVPWILAACGLAATAAS